MRIIPLFRSRYDRTHIERINEWSSHVHEAPQDHAAEAKEGDHPAGPEATPQADAAKDD